MPNRNEIAEGLMPFLTIVEERNVSPENASLMLADHFIALKDATPQLFIPTIGAILKLKEEWTFEIWSEDRNSQFLKLLGYEGDIRYNECKPVMQFSLPVGTVLKTKRIYVRSGLTKYDSVTVALSSAPKNQKDWDADFHELFRPANKRMVQWWVKLGDANKMVCEVLED